MFNLFKPRSTKKLSVRIRINGWLYYHTDDMLTTDCTKAFVFKDIKSAVIKARELHHDKECTIIESHNGRVKINTLDSILDYLEI